ncbi:MULTISPECIES: hypothetical protein [Acidithrix]|uniref:Uncharacterized protein n=1 Tax=Acidithrix ferrooxidans TaxID=1280514 RepID=A0A0D8HIM0_9ACTN|nr:MULTISPECIES: hypothetical protein [Acidithrix]KJF16896.1 hypothetical protein AXFE_22510 [Acidithrix ferrooxidans]CAG4905505.1 unnamed protein product [Acidithrix sp. C25]
MLSVREGSSDLNSFLVSLIYLLGVSGFLCAFSPYFFTVSNGAPPQDTTDYEGDQKCFPHKASRTSGEFFAFALMADRVFIDITSLDA